MPIYVFEKVARNRFCKREGPERLYVWELRRIGSQWTTSSGCSYAELEPLLRHFRVQTPEQLVGRTFESEREDASSALDLFVTIVMHGGTYEPPSSEMLRQQAAEQLSRGECPKFSGVDRRTVARAFAEVFERFQMQRDWFAGFQTQIAQLSNGRVMLSFGNKSEFRLTVRGTAEYLMLVVDGTPRRLIFGPYSTPFDFDSD